MLQPMRPTALALLCPLLLGACAARTLPGVRGAIEPGAFLLADGTPITAAQLAAATEGARYVLVGESHDSGCDHAAQAAVVRALAGREPVVGLEMVSTERQEVLDRFHRGAIGVDDLDGALAWRERWGLPFDLYRPIFEAAAEARLQVVALNVPREVARQVSQQGTAALPPEVPELVPPLPEQEPMLRESFRAHGNGSEEAFERFVRVQSLWDTAMARAAIAWSHDLGRPVVILAGAGHVTNGWGIGHRLRHLDPGAGVAEVMPWRGTAPIDPAQAALFFYCPAEG